MTTPVHQHGTPDVKPAPIYRHSSETTRSAGDAGGKVDQGAYTGKTNINPKEV
jgi:hypothetical protein